MTQWVESPTGGRDRGPVAVLRAWLEVLVRPRRFFRTGVAPGDQAPGLVFVAAVVLLEEASRVAVVELASRGLVGVGPFPYPVLGSLGPVATVVVLLGAVVVVAPAALHLAAALQTLLLIPFAPDRGGVSETVQVIAYATAPCVLAGLPSPWLRVGCTAWGFALYVVGTSEVHDLSLWRAALLTALPGALVFGYGFRGVAALQYLASSTTPALPALP